MVTSQHLRPAISLKRKKPAKARRQIAADLISESEGVLVIEPTIAWSISTVIGSFFSLGLANCHCMTNFTEPLSETSSCPAIL